MAADRLGEAAADTRRGLLCTVMRHERCSKIAVSMHDIQGSKDLNEAFCRWTFIERAQVLKLTVSSWPADGSGRRRLPGEGFAVVRGGVDNSDVGKGRLH